MADQTDNQSNKQQNASRDDKRDDDRSNASSQRSGNERSNSQAQQSTGRSNSNERSNTTPQRGNERSVGVLIRDLVMELTSLVRNEAELAKAEVSEKVSQVQTGAVSMVVAVVLLHIGLIGLMFAGIWGLSTILPIWLAALIIGGAIVIIGLIALAMGRSKLKAANFNTPRVSRQMGKDRAFVQEQTQ